MFRYSTELDKMLSAIKLKFKKNKLVSDSTPDPPRYPNKEDNFEQLNLNKDSKTCENNQEQAINNGEGEMSSNQENETSANVDSKRSDRFDRPPPPRKQGNNKKSNAARFNGKKKSNYSNIPPGNHTTYTNCTGLTVIGTKNTNILTINTTQNISNNHHSGTNNGDGRRDSGAGLQAFSPEVQALINCPARIIRKDTILIKEYIGKNWRTVAAGIGCPDGTIEQLLQHYKSDTFGEIMQRVLIKWIQAEASYATIGRLLLALWHAREYDCANQLAIAHNRKNEDVAVADIA